MTKEEFKIDFVGIGASKCGTTWLGQMLKDHPEICMSEPKEIHYFNDQLSYKSFLKPHYQRGIKWYRKFWSHCPPDKLKGEITPRYCIDPLAAERIKEHNPEIKIIFCLRDPVSRIWSQYQFWRHFIGKEDRTPLQAIMEEPDYIRMSRYHHNLSVYRKHFLDDQILLVWFEDIIKRPGELLSEIFTFIGVNPDFRPARMNEKSNVARVSRFVSLQTTLWKFSFFLIRIGLMKFVKKVKQLGVHEWINNVNSKPITKSSIPADAKAYIISQLNDDVRQLEKLVNKDLSHWLR